MDKAIKKLLKAIDGYVQLTCHDKESVHQLHKLRVSARKLVSLSPPQSYASQVFKRSIQQSNYLRDLDVLQTEVLVIFPKEWRHEIQQLERGLRELREDESVKFRLFLEMEIKAELKNLVKDYQKISKKSEGDSQRHCMSLNEIVKKLKEQLKLLKKLELEDAQVHKVRLKIKRLRYQLEHFYADESRLLSLTAMLQETLGRFHDKSQAQKILQSQKTLLSKDDLLKFTQYLDVKKQEILAQLRQALKKDYKDF